MTAHITAQSRLSLVQSLTAKTLNLLQPQASVVRNLKGQVLHIQDLQLGLQSYQIDFTWQSFDRIYQHQPRLFPLLNYPDRSRKVAERIAHLLNARDRLFLQGHASHGVCFYIPFKVVSSYIWYVEARATAEGWQVEVRKPISRIALGPYAIFQTHPN